MRNLFVFFLIPILLSSSINKKGKCIVNGSVIKGTYTSNYEIIHNGVILGHSKLQIVLFSDRFNNIIKEGGYCKGYVMSEYIKGDAVFVGRELRGDSLQFNFYYDLDKKTLIIFESDNKKTKTWTIIFL